jgi:anti-sigma factor RsiW
MTRVSILPLETDGHVETAIPWYVNETLAPEERSRIEAHLAECEQCRDSCQVELRLRQQLRISTESAECAAETGWDALVGSLSDPEPRRSRRAELRGLQSGTHDRPRFQCYCLHRPQLLRRLLSRCSMFSRK